MSHHRSAARLRAGAGGLVLSVAVFLNGCGATPAPTATPTPLLRVAVAAEVAPVLRQAAGAETLPFELQACSWRSCADLVLSGYAEAALVWGPRPEAQAPFEVEAWGADALAIVAHRRNRVGALEPEALREVFSGRVQQWEVFGQALGAIRVVAREPGSGQYEALSELVMGGEPVSGSATIAADDGTVLDYVAADPAALGFVAASSLREGVRALTIEGVRPEPQKVREGLYPLMVGVWLIYEPESRAEELRALLASQEGQGALDRLFARPELALK